MIDLKSGAATSARGVEGSSSITERTSALYEKRSFRAYREFTSNTSIKFVATKNFHLTSQRLWTGQGAAKLAVSVAGTEGGTFTALPTKFGTNTVGGGAAGATTLTVGGTHTDGTERDVLRADSGTAGGGSGNADLLSGQRYLAAGTYYFDITVTGTTSGLYSLEWEEDA